MPTPEISVVVPSHGRRLRLWWLLNALEDQSLAAERFEVIVVHDYDEDTARTLEQHAMVAGGRARLIAIPPGTGNPARQRNIGWRAARAPLIAFTDDDCRPDAGWLEALGAAGPGPQQIVQGSTRPDPFELALFAAPHSRSLSVDPPNLFAQTCNIAYPRALLDRLGGFDEAFPTAAGEDTDLALRARRLGAEVVAAADAGMFHAVESFTLAAAVRATRKWEHLPYIVGKHPELRRTFTFRVFWRPTHAEVLGVALAAALSRRRPAAAALALPWVRRNINRRGTSRRGRLASAIELPGRLIVDAAEFATLVRGSLRYKTLLL